MEFDKLLILMNWRRYTAAFQNCTNMYVDTSIEVMEFCDTVMEKSWNFVAKISWQPWYQPPKSTKKVHTYSCLGFHPLATTLH